MTHQKRMAVSKHWPIKKKGIKFITHTNPGPHKKTELVPLNVVLRDMLNLTKTTRETKKVLHEGNVLVDGIIRKDHKFPVGFLDVISLKGIKDEYIMLYNNMGKLSLEKYDTKKKKPYKIINKKMLKGKKIQLNLFNGKNILVDNRDYKVGDSVVIENNKIIKHFKFEKGQNVFLIGGKHIGAQGKIEEINPKKRNLIVIKTEKGLFETSKNYAFVTGEKL